MGLIERYQEIKEHRSLIERLRQCRIIIFDADDTLVHTDVEYFKPVIRKTVDQLSISPDRAGEIDKLLLVLDSARSVTAFHEKLGIERANFWDIFDAIDRQDMYKARLKATDIFPDVYSLKQIQDGREFMIVTHARRDLAVQYPGLIFSRAGINFPIVQTIYNYESPQTIRKPDHRLVTDMLTELGYMDALMPAEISNPLSMNRPIMEQIAVIGDSRDDLKLAHNLPGAIPVWINRDNKTHKNLGFPYLEFPDLVEFVKAVKG